MHPSACTTGTASSLDVKANTVLLSYAMLVRSCRPVAWGDISDCCQNVTSRSLLSVGLYKVRKQNRVVAGW